MTMQAFSLADHYFVTANDLQPDIRIRVIGGMHAAFEASQDEGRCEALDLAVRGDFANVRLGVFTDSVPSLDNLVGIAYLGRLVRLPDGSLSVRLMPGFPTLSDSAVSELTADILEGLLTNTFTVEGESITFSEVRYALLTGSARNSRDTRTLAMHAKVQSRSRLLLVETTPYRAAKHIEVKVSWR